MISGVTPSKDILAYVDSRSSETIAIKAIAFDAIIRGDKPIFIRRVLSLAALTSSANEKVMYYTHSLISAKEDPVLFMETCNIIMKQINALPGDEAEELYVLLSATGQKEFIKIVRAAGVETQAGKKVRKPYTRKTKVPSEYNVWIYPESTCLEKYMYQPETQKLLVKFKKYRTVYTYSDITEQMFMDLQKADSKGRFMENIMSRPVKAVRF